MYRIKVKNKDTGLEMLAWEAYDKTLQQYIFYSDIELQHPLDTSQWEEVKIKDEIGTPYILFGIECGKGWIPLIKPIIEYIDNYNENTNNDKIEIIQIKEKYSALRIYVSHGTPQLFKMIEDAEEKSQYICEFCGSTENVGTTQGYYMTLCYDCAKKTCEERGYAYKWLSHTGDKLYWINPHQPDEYISTRTEEEEEMP